MNKTIEEYQDRIQKQPIIYDLEFIKKKRRIIRKILHFITMRFQSIEKSKIYKLYRQDELQRLRKRIQQIKTRKNQHMGNSKQNNLLPFISAGFGFSQQKQRLIDKQNQRLEKKLSKVKNTHSTYYLGKSINFNHDKKLNNLKNTQSITNRSCDNLLLPILQSQRTAVNQKQNQDSHISMTTRPNNFRKDIMKIYHQSFQDKNKKLL